MLGSSLREALKVFYGTVLVKVFVTLPIILSKPWNSSTCIDFKSGHHEKNRRSKQVIFIVWIIGSEGQSYYLKQY